MPLGDLFSVRTMETFPGGIVSAAIVLNGSHPVFSGHFPGNPILPGVCTVHLIREVMEASCGKRLMMTQAGSIKYLGFVDPRQTPELVLRLELKEREDESIACTAQVFAGDKVVCSFKGLFH